MKNYFTITLASIFVAMLTVIAVRELNLYAEQEAVKFAVAVNQYKRDCLKRIHEGEVEKNLNKVLYYRHQYNNSEKAVLDFGTDFILKNKKAN